MDSTNPRLRLIASIVFAVLMLFIGLYLLPQEVRSIHGASVPMDSWHFQATHPVTAYLPLIYWPVAAPTDDDSPSLPPEDWLQALNYYRAMANLLPVTANSDYSMGAWYHARYMVKNDYLGHDEDPANRWYTVQGLEAAKSSNVMVSWDVNATDLCAINMWMQGPFHALGILDPALQQAGFGSYREDTGTYRIGAALDVIRGLESVLPDVSFPIFFPAHGGSLPVLEHWGESPSPLTNCPGYAAPSGPPIMLQMGDGRETPQVTATSLRENGCEIEHCVFDETSYFNPDSNAQSLARSILGSRDAIVLMPRQPLVPGAYYTVSITVDGCPYTWSFTAMNPADAGLLGTPAPLEQVRMSIVSR